MTKNFCDRCGREITCDIEIVFGYELCDKCQEALSNWLENKPSPEFPIYPEINAIPVEEDYWKAIEGLRKYAKSSPNLLDKEGKGE